MAAAEKGSKTVSQRRWKAQRAAKQKQRRGARKARRLVRMAGRKGSPKARRAKGTPAGRRGAASRALMATFVNDVYKQMSAEARRQRRPVAPEAAAKPPRAALPEPPVPEVAP